MIYSLVWINIKGLENSIKQTVQMLNHGLENVYLAK